MERGAGRTDERRILRAWTGYIGLYLACAVPVRLAATWWTSQAAEGSTVGGGLGTQALAGLALLPVSYLLYRRSVRRLARGGAAPR